MNCDDGGRPDVLLAATGCVNSRRCVSGQAVSANRGSERPCCGPCTMRKAQNFSENPANQIHCKSGGSAFVGSNPTAPMRANSFERVPHILRDSSFLRAGLSPNGCLSVFRMLIKPSPVEPDRAHYIRNL